MTKAGHRRFRWLGLFAAAALLAGATACHHSNDVFEASATFISSATHQAPNVVKLTGAAIDTDTVRVNVEVTGATTSSDLYSFVFDIVLADELVAQYVPGSATFGNALTPGASQGQAVFVAQEGNRVVVGVSITGGGAGNGVPAGNRTIASFQFKVPATGATNLTLAGSPTNPLNPSASPVALDSAGNVVPTIVFDAQPGIISR